MGECGRSVSCRCLVTFILTTLSSWCVVTPVDASPRADLPVVVPDANADRADIPEIYTWDLDPLFASDGDVGCGAAEAAGRTFRRSHEYEGKLADPAALAACLELYFRLHLDANFVTLYANLRQSTALSDETANAMVQRSLAAMDELMRRPPSSAVRC